MKPLTINYIFNLFFFGLFCYYILSNAPDSSLIVTGVFYITSCIRCAMLELKAYIFGEGE